LQLSAGQLRLIVRSSEFVGAVVCPGHVRARFGTLKIEVGRVELQWWRRQPLAV
jgi:hypothetical protein